MKMYALLLIIGALLGGFATYRLLPPKEVTKPIKEVVHNNVTTIKEVRADGTSTTTIIDKTVQSKQTPTPSKIRNNLLGFKYSFDGRKELTYGRQALFPNLYFTVSVIQTDNEVVPTLGILYTF